MLILGQYVTNHSHDKKELPAYLKVLPPGDDATIKEQMTYRLRTKDGRLKYKKRKETVEPVFGIIKSVLGFRQFLLREIPGHQSDRHIG